MPQLAAFPKAYLDDLCLTGKMSLRQWFELAATLDVDGVELYAGIQDLADPQNWEPTRRMAKDYDLQLPMMCCSPDFSHPSAAFRQRQVDQEKIWIDMTAELGGKYCRVLSGQRRPKLSRKDGLSHVCECIEACLVHAEQYDIVLVLENHYKDNYWKFPEFAQQMDVFIELVSRITAPGFGVNYDPSNAILAGDDPLELLENVKRRVVTMHASDRYLAEGTLEDLRKEEDSVGYAARLRHGEIGQGLNDYDAIFSILAGVGFNGWISIEDGVDGIEQLQRSAKFLRKKIAKHWPA